MDQNKEEERLKTLYSYQILDSEDEQNFDDLAKLAREVCQCPIALVSFVDCDRQWFKSRQGIDQTQTPRSISFCSRAIEQDDVFEVQDATKDSRFSDNPLVTHEPHIRFYAGAPLKAPNGHKLGTICVIDKKPNALTDSQKRTLKMLSEHIIHLLEDRKIHKTQQELLLNKARLQSIGEFAGGICHQINNPLAIIKGRAMILRHRLNDMIPEEHELYKELEVIEHTSDRVSGILKALRFYSKDLGNEIKEVRVNEILEDAILFLQNKINSLNIQFDFEKGPDVTKRVNKNQLVQVMVDVLSNAIDSLQESEIRNLKLKSEKKTDM